MITYKWLDFDKITELDPYMIARGLPTLNQSTTRVRAAYDGDTLVGFLVLQLFPHCEPLYVDPNYRGNNSEIANKLIDDMFSFMGDCSIRGFISIAESPHAEKLCIERGLEKIEYPVYIKR
jgi:hypothetical protein